MLIKNAYIILFILFALSLQVKAQEGGVSLTQDSTLVDNTEYLTDGKKSDEGFFSMFEGNPGKAALYSTIFPGAGQIYNKKWLKVPIVWGIEGTAIGVAIYFNKRHKVVDLGYKGLARGELLIFENYTDPSALKARRDQLKKIRDYSYLAIGIAHLLNIADAFVDRHLIEFDVDEDISLNFGPTSHGIGLTMAFD